jgi:Flagellar hook-length control protein FliK
MPIVITPNVSPVVAQGATAAPVVLQPGSVISVRVQQVLSNDTVRIAIGSQSLDVQTQIPLQAGQILQLAVSQTADGTVRLAVVNAQDGTAASQGPAGAANPTVTSDAVTLGPGAVASIAPQTTPVAIAPNNQLTPLETLAVSVAAQTAATQQTSLAPLFANLAVAAGLDSLPPQVQQAVAQVLAQQTSLDQNLTGADIKQAFQNSGLFLESSLASGSFSSSATATPDLKAALIVLRQVLVTSLDGATAAPSAAATSSAALTQSAVATPNVPATAAAVPPAATTPTAAGVPQSATPASVVQPGATLPVPGQGTASVLEALTQPITITAGPQTPVTASPALAPLLGPEIAAQGVLPQTAASPIPQDAASFAAVSQIIVPASAPADAAARAAASSAALDLLQGVLPEAAQLAGSPAVFPLENSALLSLLPTVAGARAWQVDDGELAHTNVPPPPFGGALPAAQAVTAATLVSNSPAETALRHLLADTDGAIARQTLLQVASLPDSVDTQAARLDPAAPRWNFEIPFATAQGTAMAQFEISRDGGGNGIDAAKRVWRARFSLDVEPAGPVHAQVTLSGDRTSVRMWAERPATAAQLRAGAAQLSQALSKAELQPGDIVIRDGTPPQSAPARAGHFLDRAL